MNDTYKTIAGSSEGFYKEKGSKFISYAFPVNSEENVKQHLDDLKKQYHDARHHCYAYLIGVNGEIFRSNDDGEPNHSAGDPILGQIKSFELSGVLVVVIRYFGGTKLGVGGLINAYKTAAQEALNNATIIKKTLTERIGIHCEYPMLNDAIRFFKDKNLEIVNQELMIDCKLWADVPLSDAPQIKEDIKNYHKLKLI
ncbi:YigZ family protein [Mangrovivirga sp. M17]|uniref:YigZ family protein n=1 Tax=Mangrovivirga halotolerans TaxID=2993936 RepID=A0ABT3RM25_9BACT|nr:YigZ family protein [Mangrovivirga halotolerans]